MLIHLLIFVPTFPFSRVAGAAAPGLEIPHVLAFVPSCICPEVRLTPDQHILWSDCCENMYHGYLRQSSRILYCIEARYLWCLRPKLHICAACCSDSKMEVIV